MLRSGHFGFPALGILGAAVETPIARLIELTYLLVIYIIETLLLRQIL